MCASTARSCSTSGTSGTDVMRKSLSYARISLTCFLLFPNSPFFCCRQHPAKNLGRPLASFCARCVVAGLFPLAPVKDCPIPHGAYWSAFMAAIQQPLLVGLHRSFPTRRRALALSTREFLRKRSRTYHDFRPL